MNSATRNVFAVDHVVGSSKRSASESPGVSAHVETTSTLDSERQLSFAGIMIFFRIRTLNVLSRDRFRVVASLA